MRLRRSQGRGRLFLHLEWRAIVRRKLPRLAGREGVAGRQREMGSLLSHRDGLEVAALRAWREAAAALRAALAAEAKEAAAAAVGRAGGASSESEAASEEELVELLLRVKNNAHRLLDEQTCAAGVGLAAAVASAEPGLLPLAGTCTTSLARRLSQRGSHPPRPQDAA